MIIIRQKAFTRGDVKAMRELYKATRGFKYLPKGRSGMKARDVINFQRLAEKIDTRQALTSEDIKNAKDALNRLGLPETSQNVEHLIKKYQNINDPEFRKRIHRIQKSKWGEYYIDADKKKDNFLRKIAENANLGNSAAFERATVDGGIKDMGNINNVYTLTKTLDKKIPEVPINLLPYDKASGYFNYKHSRISVSPDLYNPATIAHEAGHAINYKKGLTPTRMNNSSLSGLAEENTASSRGLAMLKRLVDRGEMDPAVLNRSKAYMGDSFNSYTSLFAEENARKFRDLLIS